MTITINGFEYPTLSEIRTSMKTRLLEKNPSIQFLPNHILTQIIDICADEISKAWEGQAALFNSSYITAEGAALDLVALSQGLERKPAGKAYMLGLKIVGSGSGGIIPAGSRFGSTLQNAPFFQVNADTVFVSGENRINVFAVDAGSIPFEATALLNTYTINTDSVPNISSVINDSSTNYYNGYDVETDAALRTRIQTNANNSNTYTSDAIRTGIINLNDSLQSFGYPQVQDCYVIENRNDYIDSAGRPPKSIEVSVFFDKDAPNASKTDSAVATRIAYTKPAGCQTVSTTSLNYSENILVYGDTYTPVTFSRADEKNVYLIVNAKKSNGIAFTPTEKTSLKEYLVTYGNSIGLGKNVIAYGKNSISQALNEYAGLDLNDYAIFLGFTPVPTFSDNLIIEKTEISRFSTANIEIGDL